ncbi:MAG: glycosyl hydrolase family 28-related protein [Acidimicrobiia bacterium]
MTFPSDAGLVNVRDYGAKGDGRTDDTQAIRRTIQDNVGKQRILFFPAGTYLVSDSLQWRDAQGKWLAYLTLQGEGQAHTTIKLADGAPGFDDREQPRAVVVTGSGLSRGAPSAGGKDYEGLGEGNEAFRNYVFDLTIDTGRRNPGAVGIDFLANNNGGIVDVTIRSGDGVGAVGLSMTRKWPGPALFKNLWIEGFDYGIATRWTEFGLTFENLVLIDQRVAGIHNDGNVLSIRRLTSRNTVPAIVNSGPDGLVVLLEADLSGGSPAASAISNAGFLFTRSVMTAGYRSAIEGLPGNQVEQYVYPDVFGSTNPPAEWLPVQEAARPAPDPLSEWASVTDPAFAGGADPFDSRDDTAAIQSALDSGKSTIYFPSSGRPDLGRYLINDTLVIPPSVNRIIGLESFLAPMAQGQFGSAERPAPMFRFEEGSSEDVLVLERISIGVYGRRAEGAIGFEHASPRTLVMRHVTFRGYHSQPGAGPLFLEDFCCSKLEFNGPQSIWARQLNVEVSQTKIHNRGADLWVLGIKTELPTTVIETTEEGRTEVLGGLLYPVNPVAPDTAAFVSIDAQSRLVYAVSAYLDGSRNYTVQVRATRGEETRELLSSDVPVRGGYGSLIWFEEGGALSPAESSLRGPFGEPGEERAL